jgi:hypothetical protein
MASKRKPLNQKKPEILSAKLERIACDYRNDLEVAIDNLNTELENNLTELAGEFGHKVIDAAVDAIEDKLSIDNDAQAPYTRHLNASLNLTPKRGVKTRSLGRQS